MDDSRFEAELTALEKSGAVLPISLKPREAWFLLTVLQDAESAGNDALGWAKSLAENIQGRLCKTPAMKKAAERGWADEAEEEYPIKMPPRDVKPPLRTKQSAKKK